MDLVCILILLLLTVKTANRAHVKGQIPWLWVLINLILFFVFIMIGAFVVFMFFYSNYFDVSRLGNTNDLEYRKQFAQQIGVDFAQHPLRGVTVMLFGVGGYMLVRFILNTMPDKNPPLHKADRRSDGM